MTAARLLALAALLGAQSAEGTAQSAHSSAVVPVKVGMGLCALRSTRCARVAPDTATQSFTVGGVNVVLRRVAANDVVAANLYLLGGTRLVTFDDAGVERFLLEASERGTAAYPKETLRRRMAELGTVIGASSEPEWTTFALRSTVATFDSTWAIFADRLMRPTLEPAEVELVRAQILGALRQRRDDPDAQLEFLADSAAYAGHSYGIEPAGSERSVARLTVDDLRRFGKQQMVTSRMLLVVVGNVTRAQVERLVAGTIARLPRGDYAWTPPRAPQPFTTSLVTETRALPTNYLLGYYAGPAAAGRDAYALRLATAVLTGRLFSEIRAKRNLSYAVEAPFVDRAQTAGGLYVTTVDPTQTLSIMRREITALQSGTISSDDLAKVVGTFITEYFLKNETNADQANALARAQLYQGDWRRAAAFVDELRKVTPDDLQRVARQYMHNLRFAYIGDPAKLDRRVINSF